MTLYWRQGSRPSPRKGNAKKAKRLSEEVLQTAMKRKVKSKRKMERYTLLNAEFQIIARRDKNQRLTGNAKGLGTQACF